jgi:single-strand DNA-binding protein
MSKGVNKWIGIGNVCAEPERRYFPSGSAVTNVTIACGDEYKDKNSGEKIDKTEFVRIVFFNRLAEIVGEYVKKGAKLYIEGSLRTRSWEQDGIKRYATEIVASEMQMLDSRGGQAGGDDRAESGNPQDSEARKAPVAVRSNPNGTATSPYAEQANFDDFDDDIPF